MAIDDKLKDFKEGQEATYREDDVIYRVKVMEANGDAESERYRLKVLEVVRESRFTKPSEVGEEFSCEKLRDCACCGLWYLLNY